MQILTDGANPGVVNLGEFSLGCAPSPTVAGAYVCTAILSASAGSHVFTVTAYDLPDAKGHALCINSTGAVIVKPTGTTTVALVLEGIVHSVVLALATTNPRLGEAASIGLTALLVDADENIIVGPAPYEYPVTLTTTDSADGALSKTTLKSPADTSDIDVNYNGADVASITYSATATGLPAGNVTNAVLTPGARATPTPTPGTHLYVGNSDFVSVFELADLAAAPTIWRPSPQPIGLAVDASGKVYVSTYGHVSVFDSAHGYAELTTITGDNSADLFAGEAVDASGKLYVADSTTNSVSVFDTAHGYAVLPAVAGGLNFPYGVALDASGKLFVANWFANKISVFDTAHANAQLPAITGSGVNNTLGVAVDASGKLYATNSAANSVNVFDTKHGNAPLPTIIVGRGPTFLSGVAIDPSGKLYVVNNALGYVSVFDTVHGNAALPGVSGLGHPFSVAVH
jgi:hypothetical protein